MSIEKNDSYSETKDILNQYLFFSIIFAGLLGIMSSSFVTYFFVKDKSFPFVLILSSFTLLTVIFIAIRKKMLKRVINYNKGFNSILLYNKKKGEVLKDIFGNYYPQMHIYQLSSRLGDETRNHSEKLLSLNIDSASKEILDLFSYSVLQHLKGSAYFKFKNDDEVVPSGIEKNKYLKFLGTLKEKKDDVRISMSNFRIAVIKVFKVSFDQDNDSFTFCIKNKYSKLIIKAKISKSFPLGALQFNPVLKTGGLYVNEYYKETLKDNFFDIQKIELLIQIKAEHNFKYMILSPKNEIVNWFEMLYKILDSGPIGGLSYNSFKEKQRDHLLQEIFENSEIIIKNINRNET